MVEDRSRVDYERVETPSWRLQVPSAVARLHRTVCVPTIHPAGDQRVLRCAQTALDAGYDLHLVWLGRNPGRRQPHPRIRETQLPAARSMGQRLRALPAIVTLAGRADPDLWHIHDYYLLPFARAWTARTGRPVLYDVHEYYPEYYARRPTVPTLLQPGLERLVRTAECRMAARLAGVNAVSERLANRFRRTGVPATATPNYPVTAPLRAAARPLTPDLLRRVIHIGSLSAGYGQHVMIAAARELELIAPKVELTVVARFSSEAARGRFAAAYRRAGSPANLRLIDPVPAHDVAELLAGAGIGLVANQDQGQFPMAVPTKLYEYAAMGLAVVASDLPAVRDFFARYAAGRLVAPDQPAQFARAIADLVADADRICAEVNRRRAGALAQLSWERACGPVLGAFLRSLVLGGGAA